MTESEEFRSTETEGGFLGFFKRLFSRAKPQDGQNPEQHMTPTFVTYCFSVNYILGVGVLNIPWGFNEAGYILAPILLALVSVISYICVNYILETLARAQGHLDILLAQGGSTNLKRMSINNGHSPSPQIIQVEEINPEEIRALSSDPDGRSTSVTEEDPSSFTQPLLPDRSKSTFNNRIDNTLFEIPQLCALYLPVRLGQCYSFLIGMYFLLTLWSYASVFASSMGSNVPMYGINSSNTCDIEDHSTESSCILLYTFWLAVFAVIVVPLSCQDLTEQIVLQVALSIFRFIAIGLMLCTTLQALYTYKRGDLDYDSDDPPFYSDAPAFDFSGFGKVLPIAVFSQVLHHSVPGISRPQKDKAKLQAIFAGVMTTTCVVYSVLGVILVLWYGSDIKETCTLNWTSYDAGYDPKPGWVKFLAGVIILFPPIDLISAYPLNAITLGNNMYSIFVKKEDQTKKKKLFFRLTAAMIPLIGASLVRSLSTVLRYAGCVGILIAFTYPCLLEIASRKQLSQKYGPSAVPTPYSQYFFSRLSVVYFILILSLFLFLTVFIFSFL